MKLSILLLSSICIFLSFLLLYDLNIAKPKEKADEYNRGYLNISKCDSVNRSTKENLLATREQLLQYIIDQEGIVNQLQQSQDNNFAQSARIQRLQQIIQNLRNKIIELEETIRIMNNAPIDSTINSQIQDSNLTVSFESNKEFLDQNLEVTNRFLKIRYVRFRFKFNRPLTENDDLRIQIEGIEGKGLVYNASRSINAMFDYSIPSRRFQSGRTYSVSIFPRGSQTIIGSTTITFP